MTRTNNETVGWLTRIEEDFERDPDYVAEGMALAFTRQILALMRDQRMTRVELAERLGVSRAYVTKVLNAPPNLTFRSVAAVSLALGATPMLVVQNGNVHTGAPSMSAATIGTTDQLADAVAVPVPVVPANEFHAAANVIAFRPRTRDVAAVVDSLVAAG